MMQYKKTSIIIVSYKALDYLRNCIDSIREKTNVPYELIIVDNNSGEPTVSYVEAQQDIKSIFNDKNVLLTPAQNQGLQLVDADSHYILFLNPDMRILRADWLERMIDKIESKNNFGIVGPLHNVQPIGPLFGNIDMACMMVKRKVLVDTNGLNNQFPWNGAGFILTADAWVHGWRYATVKGRLIKHYGAKSRSHNKIPNTKINQKAEISKRGLTPTWSLFRFIQQLIKRPDLIWKTFKIKYL